MLNSHQGKTLTSRQIWWRTTRMEEVEGKAYELIAKHESCHGKLPGCVVQPELLLKTLGCEHLYFGDAERADYGIPDDAIGALKPHQRFIFIHDSIQSVGREGQTLGEEMGHFVLHAKGVAGAGQQRLALDIDDQPSNGPLFFCRSLTASYVDGEGEPLWMSREAAFFGACLQMPRDRYMPAAERRLIECLQRQPETSACFRSVEEKLQQAHGCASQCIASRCDLNAVNLLMPGVFDTWLIEQALDLLESDHGGKVSRAAQKRRFAELGFAHDAAELFAARPAMPKLDRFEQYILSDQILKKAGRGEDGI